MANPNAPAEGTGRKIPYISDEAHAGTAYLPLGDGAISMGGGLTPGSVPGAAINGRVSGGLRAWGYFPDTFKPFALTAVTTEQLIWDPASGKKFRILGGTITSDTATTINVLDGTGGSTILTFGAPANVPVPFDLGPIGKQAAAANSNAYVTSSNSAAIVGTVWGVEE